MNEKNINLNLAKEKKIIINNDYELYMKLENFYKYLFEMYLMKKIDLKLYDDMINNSGLYFGKSNIISDGLKTYFGLNYIFILNHFFIEKLKLIDIELLKKYISYDNFELNEELYSIIDRTYKDIIKNNYLNDKYIDDKYKVCYGSIIPDNFVDNDALVLKICYSKNSVKLEDNDFIQNIKYKRKFLFDLSLRLQEEIKKCLNINCVVLNEKTPN